ncbi:MAG: putative membrane protein [Ignavibacteria bacterium]|nr:MAG: putative membrane protein [Ignavibacteria bacterium]KAF0162112.1 MAG: putative membrane protein [Ignavibacteria bacterium]
MEVDWSLNLLLILISLFTLAFFSSAEAALFLLDKKKIKELYKHNRLIAGYIESMLGNQRRLLVTIMLGATLVSVGASIVGVILALEAANTIGISVTLAISVQIVILSILILFIGKVAPKLWATKYPEKAAKLIAVPMYWINFVFYPASKLLTDVLGMLTKNLENTNSSTALQESEITELANLSVEQGTIEEDEHELIHGIVSFKTVMAREIMTPRVDIAAVSVEETFDDLMKVINESGHSRIPLYEDSLDSVIGIIYAKDLLPYLKSPELRKNLLLRSIARDVIYVPATKLINDLLHEFQEKKIHIGVVVDEYGGTSGLISLEDVLEEIVGEIRDEHDKDETEITKLSGTSYLVLGKVSIDEINETLGKNFSSENDDYDTLGGFILNQAGNIPKQGYKTEHFGFAFTVKEVINNRINKILVEKIPT